MNLNCLKAKVDAQNKANAHVLTLHPQLVNLFRPYVGKKIFTQSGFIHKIKQALEPLLSNTTSLRVYRYNSNYSLTFIVNTNENIQGGHGCVYRDASFSVGDIKGDTLITLNEQTQSRRTNYNVEEIIIARHAVDSADKQLSRAKESLCGFGEHDNG